MLDELQERLEQQRGKQVSLSTLERTLKRVGYTLKKVKLPRGHPATWSPRALTLRLTDYPCSN